MPKQGLIHDYDLMANRESSAQGVTCAVCDTPNTEFQWSDYHGEGMCRTCGCAYQLRGGTEEMKQEDKYPYLNLRDEFVPLAREFWKETKRWVHYGTSLSCNTGMPELNTWIKRTHPEFK